jgi:hypothetical protein
MTRVAFAFCLCGLTLALGCSGSLPSDGVGPRGDAFVITVDGGGAGVLDGAGVIDVAGAIDAAGFDAPVPISMNRRSFLVTSILMPTTDEGELTEVPTTHTFTLVLDVDTGVAVAGAYEGGGAGPLEPASDGAMRTTGPFKFTFGCTGSIEYQSVSVSIDADGRLTGTAQGQAIEFVGDMGTAIPVTMSLTGVVDTGVPVLLPASHTDTTDPLALASIITSEPLPVGVRAVLVGAGQQFLLDPLLDATGKAVFGFRFPATLLRYNEVYRLTYDGIADFAGNPAGAQSALRFPMRAVPPKLPEDGFESASATIISLAGSAVQPLFDSSSPTITGQRSIYVRSGAAVGPGRSTQLALRLGLVQGDTVVRFSYRMVDPNSYPSSIYVVAGVDGQISWLRPAVETGPLTPATIPGQGDVSLGPVRTAELPLPAGAASEIVFARVVTGVTCPLQPPPPVPGVIIDDLRVE